jgi:hypothetical protein
VRSCIPMATHAQPGMRSISDIGSVKESVKSVVLFEVSASYPKMKSRRINGF